MTEHVELRFAPSTDADTGTFRGTASAYGVLDAHGTEFAPGAFAASIAERRADGGRFPLLLHHDQTRVAGVVETLTDTPAGLEVEGRFILDTEAGREGHALARRGALSLSVGFRRLSDRPRPGGGRIITEARLVEVSAVAVASNPRTRITEVRSTAARGAAPQGGSDMEHDTAAPETRAEDTTSTADTGHETRAAVETLTSTVAELRSSLDAERARLDRIEARSGRAGVTAPANDGATETRAFTAFVRRGREAMGADEIRSLRVADDTAGGFLAPSDFRAEIIKGIEEISPIRAHATVTSTSAGELVMPKLTGRPTAVWTGGEGATTTSTEPTYGQITIPAHEAAVYVDVSQKLLEDAAINVVAELSGLLSVEYARLEGLSFVSGDGVGQPRGVMAHADLPSMNNGHATNLDPDKLISLMYGIKAAYRGRGAWFMNASTIAKVRSLKSATSGEYMFKESLADGVPPTLLGRPVHEVPDMADATSGNLPVLFGDLRAAYRVVDRVGLSLLRDPYTQATSGLVRFHSRRRVGGDLVLPEAVKALKMA